MPVKIVRTAAVAAPLIPSQYMQLNSLDTEKYLAQLTSVRPAEIVEFVDTSATPGYKESVLDVNEPLFQPMPSDIQFRRFTAGAVHTVPLRLRNMDKVARRVTVLASESPFFTITPPATNAGGKVAPGMDVIYTVNFAPQDIKDYTYDITCVTEREKFVVHVVAVGPRAVLDLPDAVDFGTGLVKHTQSRTLLVRNVGSRAARVDFAGDGPFAVTPAHAQLEVNQTMQLLVTFTPEAVGSFDSVLTMTYETGESVVTRLLGASEDGNVRLEKNAIKMDSTFVSLCSQRTFKIFNRR